MRKTDILTKSDRKRILFLAPSMRGGGSERVLTILLRHIDRNRFLPILGLLRKEGPFVSKLPEDVEVRDLQAKSTRYHNEIERKKQISKKRYIVEQYFGLSHLYDNAYRARFTTILKNLWDTMCRQMAFNIFRGSKLVPA